METGFRKIVHISFKLFRFDSIEILEYLFISWLFVSMKGSWNACSNRQFQTPTFCQFFFYPHISVTVSIPNEETLKSQSFRRIDGPMPDVFTKGKQSGNSLTRQREFVIENRNSVLDSVDLSKQRCQATE